MTDNHWYYTHTVRDIRTDLDARHITIRPHCPWQNGKV
jgi:transposase InsO family protein